MSWTEHRHVFEDRRDAGRRLAAALASRLGRDDLILALPRGGVPVAFELARASGAELDLLMVRKIGAPGFPELGLGALVDGDNPTVVLNEEVVRNVAPSEEHIERETREQLVELERRRRAYRGYRAPARVEGRRVTLVDDGVATGGTARAALEALREAGAARVVFAVPVGPPETIEGLGTVADEVVCLETPEPFMAVGAHYDDFGQTTDEEVIALLQEAEKARR